MPQGRDLPGQEAAIIDFQSAADLLERNAREDDRGITYISGPQEEVFVSYRDLYAQARRVLGALQAAGMQKGDELIFQVADSQALLEVYWACMMGGIIAVPLPTADNDDRKLKIFAVWRILNSPRLVIDKSALSILRDLAAKNGLTEVFEVIAEHSLALEHVRRWDRDGERTQVQPSDIANVLFSSGSTGEPKGTTVTHGNIVAGLHQLTTITNLTQRDIVLSWLPLTHVFGLTVFHLLAVSVNTDQYLMPPHLFATQPTLWLKKTSEHKATFLASPNFGYKLVLDNLEKAEVANWDLSHIRVIFNAGEPVSPELCDRFLTAMEPMGLKRTAMYPMWGMSEAHGLSFPPLGEEFVTWCVDRESLAIGQTVRELADRNHENAVLFADLGLLVIGLAMRIIDDQGQPLHDRMVGHIQIKGPSVTPGYYNAPEATIRAMTADGWFDTGDIGFLGNGRLVITGRAKEVIFVNGLNYYPNDIERVVQQVGLQAGNVVACGVHNVSEKRDEIVIFVAHKEGLEAFIPLALDVKRLVLQKLGLVVGDVVPIESVPRTSGGKMQRVSLRDHYAAGRYADVLGEVRRLMAQAAPEGVSTELSDIEKVLLDLAQEVFGVSKIGVHDNLSYHGATSILMTKLHARIDSLYPGVTTLSNLYAHPTLTSLAQFIDHGGSITLPLVALPKEYMAQEQREAGKVALRLAFAGDRYWKLMAVAQREEHESDVILLSLFAHLIAEITEQPRVAIQVLIGPAADRIVSLALNLAEIADVSALLKRVADTCRLPSSAYRTQELGKVRLNKDATSILPLFYAKSFLRSGVRLMDVYDLTLEVEHGDGTVTLLCEFGAERLNKRKVAELLSQYGQLLDDLLEQYEDGETASSGSSHG